MIQSFDCETVEHCWAHAISEMINKVQVEGRVQLTLDSLSVQKVKLTLYKEEMNDDHKGPGFGKFGGTLENISMGGTNLTKLVALGLLSSTSNQFFDRIFVDVVV